MIVAVHVVKKTTWRGREEEFENVYHYDTNSPTFTDSGWSSLCDQIVDAERRFHGLEVRYVRCRIHGPTNTTKAEDVMLFAKDYSDAGVMAGSGLVAPELTVMASFYIGRSPRGYKRILRKYFHVCAMGGITSSEEARRGIAQMTNANRAEVVTGMNSLKTIIVGASDNNLCTPDGTKLPLGSSPEVNPYLRTRQFRKGTRRKPVTATP